MNVRPQDLVLALALAAVGCGGLASGNSKLSADSGGDTDMGNDASGGVGGCAPGRPACTGTCSSGRCLVTLASSPTRPNGIAVDGTRVYWTTLNTLPGGPTDFGVVMSVPVDGGTATTLAPGHGLNTGADALAVNATTVFWTAEGPLNAGESGPMSVMSAPIGGGAPTTLASLRYQFKDWMPQRIAVDTTSVYWTVQTPAAAGGAVLRVPLAGGAVTTLASGQNDPAGIHVTLAGVYWADVNGTSSVPSGMGTVMSLPLGGGSAAALASGQAGPLGITADDTSVYWTTCCNPGNGTVMSVRVGGGMPTTLASNLGRNPVALVVDSTNIYWVNAGQGGGDGTVISVPVHGGTPVTLAATQDIYYGGIAVDATSVYWATGSAIMKLTPK